MNVFKFFKKNTFTEVIPGSIYVKKELISVYAYAEVIYVSVNAYGIPHVHFRFTLEPRSGGEPISRNGEYRVLALSEFRKIFTPES